MRKITILLALCSFAGCATTVKEALKHRYVYKPHVWESLHEITDNVSYMTEFEKEVLLYINMARTNPRRYAEEFLWSPNEQHYASMMRLTPMEPLQPSRELHQATSDFVEEWCAKGTKASTEIPSVKSRYFNITGDYHINEARLMYTQETMDRMNAKSQANRIIFDEWPDAPPTLGIMMMSTLNDVAIVFRPFTIPTFNNFRTAMVSTVK